MNPWQLAKDSESSHQVALFCWIAKAQQYGFKIADDERAYRQAAMSGSISDITPIPELAWIHHIPNGGTRGSDKRSAMIAGGQLKAEGVKAGVWDIFWPLSRWGNDEAVGSRCLCPGLYIEMKKPSLKSSKNPNAGLSEEQIAFGNFVYGQGYKLAVCYTWEEAAKEIEKYYLQS